MEYNGKLRHLYVFNILYERTDEDHPLTTNKSRKDDYRMLYGFHLSDKSSAFHFIRYSAMFSYMLTTGMRI